jgi:hypothetical protein
MAPLEGFGGGQAGFDLQQLGYELAQSSDDATEEEGELAPVGENYNGANQGGADKGRGASARAHVESDASRESAPTHYFVDIPNPEENTYDAAEQHVQINPTLRAQLQAENEHDISHFLALPEIILAKKRKR